MTARSAELTRETAETQIRLALNLDGGGACRCSTGVGFLDHMLTLAARHGRFDLTVEARGDLEVDDHHLVEDIGIVLGKALASALGEKRGIRRYGSVMLPMDEVLVAVAVDLGGRFAFRCDYQPRREKVGDLSTEMVAHFFQSLASESRIALHFRFLDPGENEHHRIEAMFKGFGRALREAAATDPEAANEIPSTKGVL